MFCSSFRSLNNQVDRLKVVSYGFLGPGMMVAVCIGLLQYKGILGQTMNEAFSCLKMGLVREIRRLREEHTDLVLCVNE